MIRPILKRKEKLLPAVSIWNIITDMLRFPKIRSISLVLISVCLFSAIAHSQGNRNEYKFDQFDPKTEDPILFERKASSYLKALAESGGPNVGYVNLYSNEPLAQILMRLAGEKLGRSIVLLRPGVRSRNLPTNIEFWIVGRDSKGPFPVVCGFCECPILSVDGKTKFEMSDVELTFNANVAGVDIKYKWKVTGGEIAKGQGTPSIVVKPNFISDIKATVEIEGLDPACNCPTEASAETIRDN